MKKGANSLINSCILAGITTAVVILLGVIIVSPVFQLLVRTGVAINVVMVSLLQVVKCFGGMLLSIFLYSKLVAKCKMQPVPAIAVSAVYGVLCLLTGRLATILAYLIFFVFAFAASYVYFLMSKTGSSVNAPQSSGSTYTEVNGAAVRVDANQGTPAYGAPAQMPEDMDSLCNAILNAIRPTLKAPITATLCDREQMTIVNNNGEYEIQGYVSSQNSYGAMIATDFKVKARYSGGNWIIFNVSVGVKSAKNYAKNFTLNYIAISIFVAVMGLLGYLILTMVIG